MDRVFLCIDLKTFFASVECVLRNLDPFKTDLVVADPSRGNGAICLAITPKMKARGIKNRCRYFEIPKSVKPIIAKPRMKKYIEYSAWIYSIYLKYVSEDDIHVYSIDECFLDITNYLKLYNLTPLKLAKKIIKDVYDTTGLTAAAGIGTNMYLTKIALDISAKHSDDCIGYLDCKKYQDQLWHHTPLTDFWQIGNGIANRLAKLHLKDMYDVAHCNEKLLYKEFGINAKYLIDHSWGIETCTIKDIKSYKSKNKSISNSQILFSNYDYKKARIVLTEMIDNLLLTLVKNKLYTNLVCVYIGYSKDEEEVLKISKRFDHLTNSYNTILKAILDCYDKKINKSIPIRRIGLSFNNLDVKKFEQLDLFNLYNEEKKDLEIELTINNIKEKYGRNSILRGVSLEEGATQKERNALIGGHNAE